MFNRTKAVWLKTTVKYVWIPTRLWEQIKTWNKQIKTQTALTRRFGEETWALSLWGAVLVTFQRKAGNCSSTLETLCACVHKEPCIQRLTGLTKSSVYLSAHQEVTGEVNTLPSTQWDMALSAKENKLPKAIWIIKHGLQKSTRDSECRYRSMPGSFPYRVRTHWHACICTGWSNLEE